VVTDALAQSTMRIMGPKYMTAGMGDAGACHPRDNIALRWLAQEYGIGYDMFDTIMHAREIQARNLAKFLVDQAKDNMPIVIHGKAYKPDVPYCIGSYSTLVGFYVKEMGRPVKYLDPLADDPTDVIDHVSEPCVLLLAHNRLVTYGYTGDIRDDTFYCDIPEGSVIVDPWRRMPLSDQHTVIHYGNTRDSRAGL
jgi:UDPglucose 6-dehydrogenase